ncbi:MAG: hypothetical protein Q4D02_01820 [Clostridia bacterium]|nr:hypothetical protein [Clostridia bacterium]
MALRCKIKVKHNYKGIESICDNLPKVVEQGVEEILKNIQGYAIRLEKGHNTTGILVEMIETSTGKVKGKVYADPEKFMTDDNISYLWFEYFGTGEFAEKEHIGVTKHFKESGYVEWYIPKNKVKRSLSYPIKVINGQEFYIASGAEPNHFLTDAEFKTRDDNLDVIQEKLYNMIKEACK